MIGRAQRILFAFLAAVTLAVVVPSARAGVQDGLVNVAIGEVTILRDVKVDVAAPVAANLCGIRIDAVAGLGRAVDRSGRTETVCATKQGLLTLRQN